MTKLVIEQVLDTNMNLVPNDQEVKIGNQVLSTALYILMQTIEMKEQ